MGFREGLLEGSRVLMSRDIGALEKGMTRVALLIPTLVLTWCILGCQGQGAGKQGRVKSGSR